MFAWRNFKNSPLLPFPDEAAEAVSPRYWVKILTSSCFVLYMLSKYCTLIWNSASFCANVCSAVKSGPIISSRMVKGMSTAPANTKRQLLRRKGDKKETIIFVGLGLTQRVQKIVCKRQEKVFYYFTLSNCNVNVIWVLWRKFIQIVIQASVCIIMIWARDSKCE